MVAVVPGFRILWPELVHFIFGCLGLLGHLTGTFIFNDSLSKLT